MPLAEVELLVYEVRLPVGASKAEFDRWYSRYLLSAVWYAKRGAVLRRANHQCVRCRRAPAAEVHHLTYVRVGREHLCDLQAVCRACHQRIHQVRSRYDLVVASFDVEDIDADVGDVVDVEELRDLLD